MSQPLRPFKPPLLRTLSRQDVPSEDDSETDEYNPPTNFSDDDSEVEETNEEERQNIEEEEENEEPAKKEPSITNPEKQLAKVTHTQRKGHKKNKRKESGIILHYK